MAILYVKKDGSGNHTTIQAAMGAALAGDTIEVEAGTFQESIEFYKNNVILKGAGRSATIIEGISFADVSKTGCSWAASSTTISVPGGTTGFTVGQTVESGSLLPANVKITAIEPTSITVSSPTASAQTNKTVLQRGRQATIQVRATGGTIKDMKIVGFDTNVASNEMAGIYFRNLNQTWYSQRDLPAAANFLVDNCHIEAVGEYALLSDSAAAVGNITVNNCYVSGKTFVGENPAGGDQFSVMNVPRQLVTFQSANLPITFTNNVVEGVTGGLKVDGNPQFNTAVTIDARNSTITNNTIRGTHGYGYALRVRGYGTTVSGNKNYSLTTATQNANYYVLPSWASGAAYAQDAVVFSSSKYWKAKQAHTSAAANSPTSASSATFWQEIVLAEVNATPGLGVAQKTVGSNITIEALLVSPVQPSPSGNYQASMDKTQLAALPAVSSSSQFSSESSWAQVSYIYKNTSSAKRMIASFRGNYASSAASSMKLRGAVAGESYQLWKIIIRDSSRSLLTIRRSDIPDVSSLDFTVQ